MKLIKTVSAFITFCHTTLLIKALRVKPIFHIIHIASLNPFRSCVMNNSSTSSFYFYLYHIRNSKYVEGLVSSGMEFSRAENIDMVKYILNGD